MDKTNYDPMNDDYNDEQAEDLYAAYISRVDEWLSQRGEPKYGITRCDAYDEGWLNEYAELSEGNFYIEFAFNFENVNDTLFVSIQDDEFSAMWNSED